MPISSKQAAQHLEDEQREEGAELVRVAVHALDHLARGAVVVVGHVQREGVGGEVLADVVCGGPAHALGEVGSEDLHELLDHRDGDEGARRGGERPHSGSLLRFVYEVADDLREGELEAQAEEEQDSQGDDKRELGAQVAPEEAAVLSRLDLDGRFAECDGEAHGGFSGGRG